MFVEEKTQGEAVPVKVGTLKLSEAIRLGKPLVGTEDVDFRLCAIGCAWAGVKGARMTADELYEIVQKSPRFGHPGNSILAHLGFPKELGARVSYMHSSGVPALKIAELLEREGQ